ncbi:Fic family protein [Roseomonas sp. CCTCC AB2023176]|uniref:Fic family protein n=1 Tax=Roseomonas sp. CCTCC AB2023176 TaxID=3342640 RepID=UPI0035D9A2B9
MTEVRDSVARRRAELDAMRPLPPEALRLPEHAYDLEITYTSNAVEGNTLTAAETSLVVENGITVGGKPLKDHLEALDHFDALRFVRSAARDPAPLREADVRNLHRLILARSAPEIAGQYARHGRFALTESGRHAFPSPAEIPALMGDFAAWLSTAPDEPATAFDAHRRLVDIHPFEDGHGRTARLLMNLMLIRGGDPPIAIRPEDRPAYLRALGTGQAGGGTEAFDRLLWQRLGERLDDMLCALRSAG